MQADLGFRAARGTPSAESLMLQIPVMTTKYQVLDFLTYSKGIEKP